ncbi:hypothetical protein RF679_01380 [Undibacterium cyanobacteriorum]|uniref:Lipoprotein n=1 Tax=Undibacterium cyanobacteriorum TaxID=3073561 RepID=A0ABY9RIA2_9BURK|nr:hypothetical protein [Undibacterium sp. 20NA77.5]WMW80948.1 hypothetical protein RF679_01380 [Undibacterium sp. 20NA77.5]
MEITLPTRITFASLILTCLSLSACQQLPLGHVQETIPGDIAQTSQVLMVKDRHKINNLFADGYFAIGNYAITGIKKGSISSTNSSVGLYSQSSSKTDFRFKVSDQQTQWDVRCDLRAEGNVVRLFGVDGVSQKNNMHCQMQSLTDVGTASQQASFDLSAEMDSPRGQVVINQDAYSMRAYSYGNPHPDRTRIPEIFGFRIDNANGNQAAIELAQTPGRAWLNTKLNETQKTALVASLAALLIRFGS